MSIYINELSFVGQAKTLEDASELLHLLAKVASETKRLRGDNNIQRHRYLSAKKILGNQTINQLFGEIEKIDNPIIKDRIRRFLLECVKGPFFDKGLNRKFPNHTCTLTRNQKDVSGSCLAASALSPSGGVVISLKNAAGYAQNKIQVSFIKNTGSSAKNAHVKNYCDTQSVKNDI